LVATILALALAAQSPGDPQDVAKRLQAYYEGTRDLEARFVQTYSYAAFGRAQVSKGTLLVKKPGKMRWDYAEPARKTIAVDGPRLVQWEPDANQAFVDDRFDATAMSAAVAFLLGKGSLAKEFLLSLDGEGWLVCTPRAPDPRVQSIAFRVGAGGEVTTTRVRDAQGNVNEIVLEGAKRNGGLADAAFEVKIPAGARRLTPPGRE